jgi:ubiquinone/menaquinone biosynthesis C-methylase UbiE
MKNCLPQTNFVSPSPSVDAQILDVGCGTGVQIQDLADLSNGTITSVDNLRQFLDIITTWTDREGSGGRVRFVNASMETPLQTRRADGYIGYRLVRDRRP